MSDAGSTENRGDSSLWRNRAFVRVWSADAASVVGSEITAVAVPLIAAIYLNAGPLAIGVLSAAQYAPYLVVPLLAGALVDRTRRKPLLIRLDLARGLLLLSIPATAAIGSLSMPILGGVAFAVTALTVVAQVGFQSLVPSAVDKGQLVPANSAISASQSVGNVVGPGIGGGLVQLTSGPGALLIDAVSYFASAVFLASAPLTEASPRPATSGVAAIWGDIRTGLRQTLATPVLRTLVAQTSTYNFFFAAIDAVLVLFAVRQLDLSAVAVGAVFSVGGLGAVLGAACAQPLARNVRLGYLFLAAAVVSTLPWLALPLLQTGTGGVLGLGVILFLGSVGQTIFNIHHVSLRQSVVPIEELGKVSGSIRFLNWGGVPVGALVGGVLASWLGLAGALLFGAVGMLMSCLILLFSPLRSTSRAEEITFGAGFQADPSGGS